MNHRFLRRFFQLTVVVLALAGCLSVVEVSAVQVAQTAPPTTVTTIITATTILTSTAYSLTTTTTSVTATSATQSTTALSTTTISTTTSTTSQLTETQSTVTMTTTSSQFIQVLGNQLGELIVGIVAVVAIVSTVAPSFRGAFRQGVVCEECGHRNPPFAKSFCTKCGKTLARRGAR